HETMMSKMRPTTSQTLSLHDALPIFEPTEDPRQERERRQRQDLGAPRDGQPVPPVPPGATPVAAAGELRAEAGHDEGDSHGNRLDRKSTRLNSSHLGISYAVLCL